MAKRLDRRCRQKQSKDLHRALYHTADAQPLQTHTKRLPRETILGVLKQFPFNLVVLIVQSLSSIWLFATPRTAAHHAPLSFSISWSFLKLVSTESMMPPNHLILCRPLLLLPSIFSSIRVFSNELALHIRWQNIGASASILPMNIQSWFPLGHTGLSELSRIEGGRKRGQ